MPFPFKKQSVGMRLSLHKCNFFNACLCQDKQYIFCKEHSSLHLHSENFFSKVALTDSNGNEVAKLVQTANCLQFLQTYIYFSKIEKLLFINNQFLVYICKKRSWLSGWGIWLRNQIPSGIAKLSPANCKMKLILSQS